MSRAGVGGAFGEELVIAFEVRRAEARRGEVFGGRCLPGARPCDAEEPPAGAGFLNLAAAFCKGHRSLEEEGPC